MKKNKKLQNAIKIFRKAGGILRMTEALRLGIHRRELYQLRDFGQLEVLDRGLFLLSNYKKVSFSDFIKRYVFSAKLQQPSNDFSEILIGEG